VVIAIKMLEVAERVVPLAFQGARHDPVVGVDRLVAPFRQPRVVPVPATSA
jgi:hypothetical protein